MKRQLAIVLIILLTSNCSYKRLSRGVMSDANGLFHSKKRFIYELAFSGIIEKRIECKECDINKYSLSIRLSDPLPNIKIIDRQYYWYYHFRSDSILEMAVSKSVFLAAKTDYPIRKKANDSNVEINERIYNFLSENRGKWLQ
ncbi:MAG: hypothetical protein HYZ44_06815 [Bacteroidetes bacterium]|nr:hypothetical protein [Bacteroidota bacterium]